MLLRLLVTLILLYVIVGWFLWPKLAALLAGIAEHYSWMRP